MMRKQQLIFFIGACLPFGNVISQDCPPNSLKTAVDARFVVNADYTVSDLETGLVWKRCSEGQSTVDPTMPCGSGSIQSYTWQGALNQANTVNNGTGYAQVKSWRLPNIKELESIVEWGCQNPAFNSTVFPLTSGATGSASERYWSSTTLESDPTRAWYIGADDGRTQFVTKDTAAQVILVYDLK